MNNPFSSSVFDSLGFSDAPAEEQDALKQKILSLAGKRAYNRLVRELTEAQRSELTALESAGAAVEEIDRFASAALPNREDLVLEELFRLKGELLGIGEQIDEFLEK